MPQNEQLEKYINESRQAGMSDEEIERNLLEAGWEEEAIKENISGYMKQPSQSEYQIPRKNKNIWLIIAIAVFAVVIIGGGVWWWTERSPSQPAGIEQIEWQTFNSAEETGIGFDFTMKYPASWSHKGSMGSSNSFLIPFCDDDIVGCFETRDIQRGILNGTASVSVEEMEITIDYVTKVFIVENYNDGTKRNVVVDGYSGVIIGGILTKMKSAPFHLASVGQREAHLVIPNVNGSSFTFSMLTEDVQSEAIFNEIVSSINFNPDSAPETADWQTYRNEEYGFEVKYPEDWRMDNDDGNNLLLSIIPKEQKTCEEEWGGCYFEEITLSIAQNKKGLHIEELLLEQFSYDDDLYEESVKELKKVEFEEYDAWEFTYLSPMGFSPENNFWIQLEDGNFLQIIGSFLAEEQEDIYQQIISSFRRIYENNANDWLPFKASYFTLSFEVPPGFEVDQGQNHIYVAKSPYYARDTGDDNAFFKLNRYNKNKTYESQLALYRELLKNRRESNITIDNLSFLAMEGDDYGRFEGDSAGKVFVVFFDASWLEIIERPANTDQSFDPIATGKQMLSTFKFSK